MAINAAFPTLSSPTVPNFSAPSVEQRGVTESSGAKTQIQAAVAQTDGAESASNKGLSGGNNDGRGQLVDVKI